MRVTRLYGKALPFLFSLGVIGCADFNTVGRTTDLPINPTRGVAIHLDAQQRVVVYDSNGNYCAEPSPDALAVYAASLGAGGGVTGRGAASGAAAFGSAAGSIGLRTQSITLMRDALYRLCEARANGSLTPASASALLARSQDLTAVVVAVEQLTGAVVANQVALTASASADASALLSDTQKLLDFAREDEAKKQKDLDAATTARGKQDEAVKAQKEKADAADKAAIAAQKAYDMAFAANMMDPNLPMLKGDLDTKQENAKTEKENLAAENKKLEAANAEVKQREEFLAEAKKVREKIEAAKDTAVTQAAARTTGSAQFSTPAQKIELDKEATEAISKAVQAMVTEVLHKDYTVEGCTALITSSSEAFQTNRNRAALSRARETERNPNSTPVVGEAQRIGQANDNLQALCRDLLVASASLQAARAEASAKAISFERSADFVAKVDTVTANLNRVKDLSDAQALKVMMAMDPRIMQRDARIQSLAKGLDPMGQRLRDAPTARRVLQAWIAIDDRDETSVKQWTDALDAGTK